MWRFFKPSPLLLLIAASTLQRGNAELGCDSGGWLQDESKCWAGDINRVFGGNLAQECSVGYASIFFVNPLILCTPFALPLHGFYGHYTHTAHKSLYRVSMESQRTQLSNEIFFGGPPSHMKKLFQIISH